jgi:two-component system chemotaxis response regulator CheY
MPRILAVDDSPSMRQMVKATLSSAGYHVEQAEDGMQALQLAGRERFDLVITDVNMPNMDGIALVRELRGTQNYKFVPLLILTTESTAERKQQGKSAGATGWLVKPFNPERLLATVAKVLA